jgi:hypothetical protein
MSAAPTEIEKSTRFAANAGDVDAKAPVRLAYLQVPNPMGEGDILAYDTGLAEFALDAGARGAPLVRIALGPSEPPEETRIRAAEAQLRRGLHARARVALGRAFYWSMLGVAFSLLWVNFSAFVAAFFFWFPPLAVFILTLGSASGGALLAVVVGLLPLIWAWAKAWQHLRQSGYWRKLARFVGSRRFRSAPLERQVDPALAAFWEVSTPTISRLRSQVPALQEKGADGVAEAAQLARTLHLQAAQHGLMPAALVYHEIYSQFGANEVRLSRQERSDTGMLSERKLAKAIGRVRESARGVLAPFAMGRKVPTKALAPFRGFLWGALLLLITLVITGTYFVPEDHAVIMTGAAERMTSALAVAGGADRNDASRPLIIREPGYHWSLPEPFVSRHTVTLGAQRLQLRAPFRQSAPGVGEVVAVDLVFRIIDIERWARIDREGAGAAQLSAGLSEILEAVIQRSRVEAREAVILQNPALANDEAQVVSRADQLVQQRMEEIVRFFIAAASNGVREQGIELGPNIRVEMRQVRLAE